MPCGGEGSGVQGDGPRCTAAARIIEARTPASPRRSAGTVGAGGPGPGESGPGTQTSRGRTGAVGSASRSARVRVIAAAGATVLLLAGAGPRLGGAGPVGRAHRAGVPAGLGKRQYPAAAALTTGARAGRRRAAQRLPAAGRGGPLSGHGAASPSGATRPTRRFSASVDLGRGGCAVELPRLASRCAGSARTGRWCGPRRSSSPGLRPGAAPGRDRHHASPRPAPRRPGAARSPRSRRSIVARRDPRSAGQPARPPRPACQRDRAHGEPDSELDRRGAVRRSSSSWSGSARRLHRLSAQAHTRCRG